MRAVFTLPALFETLLAGSSAAMVSETVPEGRWGGHLVEERQNQREYYTVLVTVTQDGVRILYPDQHCGGGLRYDGRNGNSHVFREVLDTGTDRCEDGIAELTFSGPGGEVAFYWTNPGSTVKVAGSLESLVNAVEPVGACDDCEFLWFEGEARCDRVLGSGSLGSEFAVHACYDDVDAEVEVCRARLACQ